jgi:hypothetical protein
MRPGRPFYCALLLDSELYSNLNCFWPPPRGLEPDQSWTSLLTWKPLLDFFYSIPCTNHGRMHECHVLITMSTTTALDADEEGEHVDQKEYRSMIGSLLYLTVTRPDIQFSVCLCAHFQASPRTLHRQAVKHIFMYLRHTPVIGLTYSASSSFVTS